MNKKAVIFDMDGTLANIDKRRKYLEQEPRDWVSFHSRLETDLPNKTVVKLSNTFFNDGYEVIICTGRFEEARDHTKSQIDCWGVPCHMLLMRENGDFRPDVEIKKEMWCRLVELGFFIDVTVDDRNSVVKMWRDIGLTCLQVAEGDF